MIDEDFDGWKRELLFTGRIVQDGDTSVPDDEAERRCRRYIELVDMVDPLRHGEPTFLALAESMQVEEDYEVYQATMRVMESYPSAEFGRYLVRALPDLIRRETCWASELLGVAAGRAAETAAINTALAETSPDDLNEIMAFVDLEEDDGWLEDSKGVIRPAEPRSAADASRG